MFVRNYDASGAMKRALICLLVTALLALPFPGVGRAAALLVDVDREPMNFGTPTLISGTAKEVNAVYAYDNVLTKNGIQVDGKVTIVDKSGSSPSLSDIDQNATPASRFNPKLTTGDGGGSFLLRFDFIDHETQEPVQLKNFYITVIDIDGSSASSTEYVETSGFASYTLSSLSELVVTNDTGPGGSGRTRFRGISSSLNGLAFENKASVIMNYTAPVSTVNVVIGNTNNLANREFSINFGAPGGVLTNPVVTNNVSAPTITMNVADGGDGQLTPGADNLSAVPITGTTSAEDGQTVTVVATDSANGTHTFSATVHDGGVYSLTADLSALPPGAVTITANVVNAQGNPAIPASYTGTITAPVPNDAPVASAVSIGGTAVEGGVLTGVYTYTDAENDEQGTSLFQWYAGSQSDGSDKAPINGATSLTYTPVAADAGKYLFFEVTPVASAGTATGTPVLGGPSAKVNARPVAEAQSVKVNQDGSKAITLTGSDEETAAGSLTYAIAAQPQQGTLTPVAGQANQYTYAPDEGSAADDSFTFTVTDTDGGVSAAATVTIDVNAKPSAVPGTINANEGGPTRITLTGTDAETAAGSLTFSIETQPQHGSIAAVPGHPNQLDYTPDAGATGDSIGFVAIDVDGLSSDTAYITINVNKKPNADAQAVEVNEDGSRTITLTGTDTETAAGSLTYSIATQPQHGTLTPVAGHPNQYTYTPDAGSSADDSFTFTVTDGNGAVSEAATVTVDVNAKPTASDQTVQVNEDGSKTITLTGTDAETAADGLTYAIAAQPQHGTLTPVAGQANQYTYEPEAGSSTDDSFTFTVTDEGGAVSAAATVTVDVNAKPVANDQTVQVNEDGSKTITLAGTDAETAAADLAYTIATQPLRGTLTPVAGHANQFTYAPEAGSSEDDSFTFTVTDAGGAVSEAATVTVDVNAKPTASDQTVQVNEDGSKTITLAGEDAETAAGNLTYAIAAQPQHGALTPVAGQANQYTYEPVAGSSTDDSFTFTVTDEGGAVSAAATVTIDVNAKPTADGQTVRVNEGGSKTITLTGSDTETAAGELTYAIAAQPQHGTLTPVAGQANQYTYAPDMGSSTDDSFTFTVTDEGGAVSAAATVTVDVNAKPTADGQTVRVNEGGSKTITLTGSDTETAAGELTYAIAAQPQHGTLTAVAGQANRYTYAPNAGSITNDSFTFTVTDGDGLTSAAATVALGVNAQPQANAQTVEADEDGTVTVTLAGSDTETAAGSLTYTIVGQPVYGTLTPVDGNPAQWVYAPGAAMNDSFTFAAVDEDGFTSAPTRVDITVRAALDGWVGSRDKGSLAPVVIAPGDPLKLSAVSSVEADRVTAYPFGEGKPGVALTLANGDPASDMYYETVNYKLWQAVTYYVPDGTASGGYQAFFEAEKGSGGQAETLPAEGQHRLANNGFDVVASVSLKGTVTGDGGPGEPVALANADIALYDSTGLTPATKKVGNETVPLTVRTDAQGRYDFGSIPVKNYLIVVRHDGYGEKRTIVRTLPADPAHPEIVQDFTLVPFQISLKANPSAIVGDGHSTTELTAVVTDKDGKPLAGVPVSFGAPAGVGAFLSDATGTTDAKGTAKITYRSAKIEGILSQYIPLTVTVNDPDRGLYGQDQILITFQPARVQGVVTVPGEGGGANRLVPGTPVKLTKDFDGDGVIDFSAEAVTDEEGKYAIAVPRGDVSYDLTITKPFVTASGTVPVEYRQSVEVGAITGTGSETFEATKTIAGVVGFKPVDAEDGEGQRQELFDAGMVGGMKVYLKDKTTDAYILDELGRPKAFDLQGPGVFSAEGVQAGREYELELKYVMTDDQGQPKEIFMNRNKDGSFPTIKVDAGGEMNLVDQLVDPYGDVTDPNGNLISDAKVMLYFADTARNAAKGYIKDTGVVLPAIPGFEPHDNASPEQLTVRGKYAYMVYPEADYYLVVSKPGYVTYTSPTIGVDFDIVRHDVTLQFVPTPAGPFPAPKPEPGPAPKTELTVNVSVKNSTFEENGRVDLVVEYRNTGTEALKSGTVKVMLPDGATIGDAGGGTVDGSTISWKVEGVAAGATGTFTVRIGVPEQQKVETLADIKVLAGADNGSLDGAANGEASVRLLFFSNRFDPERHLRYILGYPDNMFKPKRTLTRAELAAVMARLVNGGGTAEKAKFKDVKEAHWASGYIRIVTDNGLFTGFEDGTFHPDDAVTREELAAVMTRYLKLSLAAPVNPHFSDAQGRWSTVAIEALYRNALVSGYPDGTFKPAGLITREEAVTFINRLLFRGPLTNVQASFPDVKEGSWSFGHVEEATMSHESTRLGDGTEVLVKAIGDSVE